MKREKIIVTIIIILSIGLLVDLYFLLREFSKDETSSIAEENNVEVVDTSKEDLGIEELLERLKTALETGDYELYLKVYPLVVRDMYRGMISEESFKQGIDRYIERYGEEYKLSYKVLSVEDMDEEWQEDYSGEEVEYNGQKYKLDFCKEVWAQLDITGSKDSDSNKDDLMYCSVGGYTGLLPS